MPDFLIELQAKLDEAKSKSNINDDINKIQKQLNELKIQASINATIDQKAIQKLADDIGKIVNQKIIISNIGIDNSLSTKEAEKTGQNIGNAINQGLEKTVKKTNETLKSFSDLKSFSELHKNIENINVDSSSLKEYKTILDNIKDIYSEFGQVKITNEIFDNGVLKEFKVNIEQVNGDLKETKSFVMSLNEDGSEFVFDGIIKGAESIVQHLDKSKNAINQTADAINELKNQARLDDINKSIDNGNGISKYQNQIDKYIKDFQRYGLSIEEAKNQTQSLQDTLDNMKGMSGQQLIDQADKLEQGFKDVKISVDAAKISYDKFEQPASDSKIANTILNINKFLQNNSRITEDARVKLEGYVKELSNIGATQNRLKAINDEFKKTQSAMSVLDRLGKSFWDQIKEVRQNVTSYLSVYSAFNLVTSKVRNSVVELKEINNILTEISKTSDLTIQELEKLGGTSFKAASKYGKSASDYLTGIQEMSRSGFYGEKGAAMAEQSLLAQAAGDMTADVANNYILATNAAYKYNGEAEKLNAVLDGQNSITNRNSVGLEDMAVAMSKAGTVASSYRVSIEDLSAMIGTIEAVTKSGGDEVGNSIKSILINLQNITSSKIVNTLDAANASMTEFVNGAEMLRDPISILRDLSKTFVELDESDPLRAEILTNIGGKYQAAKLAALLQNMEMFDKMLVDYSEGTGSAMEEAMKSATNWEGSLKSLGNTWTGLINNFVNSDVIITGINALNAFLSGANKVAEKLGTFGAFGAGAGLFASLKNVGGDKMYSPICYLF